MWARIENDVVVELTNINPSERFHPSLIWKKCPDATECGMVFDGTSFKYVEETPEE
jgi:hypothetical protein